MDKKLIAYCGLDCEKCEARIATINDDDELRKSVAKKWSEMNQVEITPEMINCLGCRGDGVKFPFCASMCPIKKCAQAKNLHSCGECGNLDNCQTIRMITDDNPDALERLKK